MNLELLEKTTTDLIKRVATLESRIGELLKYFDDLVAESTVTSMSTGAFISAVTKKLDESKIIVKESFSKLIAEEFKKLRTQYMEAREAAPKTEENTEKTGG